MENISGNCFYGLLFLYMPVPETLVAQFEEDAFYHVLCKSIGGQLLFLHNEDRAFFQFRYNELLNTFVDVYAYNLLNNHVHLLIKTRSAASVALFLNGIPQIRQTLTQRRFISGECTFHELIEQQFSRLFISYTLMFNKAYNRKGHLFNRPFRRIAINDDAHLTQLFVYIHANSMHHGFMQDFEKYEWSSFKDIISLSPTMLRRALVLEWFGGTENFKRIHKELAEYYYRHPVMDREKFE